MLPSTSRPEPASRHHGSSSSQSGMSARDPFSQPLMDPNSSAQSTSVGLWSEQGTSGLSMANKAPSTPLTQALLDSSLSSMPVTQNISSQSLPSLASGSASIPKGRSPSPILYPRQDSLGKAPSQGLPPVLVAQATDGEQGDGNGGRGAEQQGEVEQLRQKLQYLEAQHEEEVKQIHADHAALVAAIQAQAVSKMKELIEKVTFLYKFKVG